LDGISLEQDSALTMLLVLRSEYRHRLFWYAVMNVQKESTAWLFLQLSIVKVLSFVILEIFLVNEAENNLIKRATTSFPTDISHDMTVFLL
jgi:hypothetical protein